MLDKIRLEMGSVIENWRGKSVVVLGDMILDELIYGVTDRVSREAPVVIVRYDTSEYVPGGAANAVRNVSSLGGSAVPIGFVGGDEAGKKLMKILRDEGTKDGGMHSGRLVRRVKKGRKKGDWVVRSA